MAATEPAIAQVPTVVDVVVAPGTAADAGAFLTTSASGAPRLTLDELAADDAVQAADWVLFANPNQLGPEYNAKIFAGWAEVWRLLGWDR